MEQITDQEFPNKVTGASGISGRFTAEEANLLKEKINEAATELSDLETSVENIKRPGEIAFSEAIPFALPSAKTSINVIQDYTLSLGAEAVADSFHTIKTTGNGVNTIAFPSSWINGNGGVFDNTKVQRIILYFDGDYVTYTITDLGAAGVIDDVQPTVTITSTVSGTTSETSIPLVITLSEASTDFAASDIVVVKGTISGFEGSGMNYTANVIPNEAGLVTVNIPSGAFTDAEGNPNVASSQFSVIYEEVDTAKPAITISSTESGTTSVSPIPLTFTLSEASTDFTSADVVVTNGTLQNFAGSGVNYTADLVPTAPGVITVNVLADSFTDAAGNGNIVATEFSITYEEAIDENLELHIDASDANNFSLSGTKIIQANDLSGKGKHLTQSIGSKRLDLISNEIVFNDTNLAHLIRTSGLEPFQFQDQTPFTIILKGVNIVEAKSQFLLSYRVISGDLGIHHGWSIFYSVGTQTIQMTMFGDNGAGTGVGKNAQYAIGAFTTKTNIIITNESGVLKIYDATNANVGTNGSTTISSINYTGLSLMLGSRNPGESTDQYFWTGKLGSVEILSRVLNESERAIKLGL